MKPSPTTEVKHSKLPWRITRDGDIIAERETLLLSGVALPACHHPQARESEANARFIVLACNSHPALTSALQHIVGVLRECESDGQFTAANAQSILNRAEAALASAKEGV